MTSSDVSVLFINRMRSSESADRFLFASYSVPVFAGKLAEVDLLSYQLEELDDGGGMCRNKQKSGLLLAIALGLGVIGVYAESVSAAQSLPTSIVSDDKLGKASDLLSGAIKLEAEGKLDEAIRLHTNALKLKVGCLPCLLGRGRLYLKKMKYVEAETDFRRIAQIMPDFGEEQGYLARALILQGKSQEAMEPAAKAHKLDEESLNWTIDLGHVYLLTGANNEAESYYLRAIKRMVSKAEYNAMLEDLNLFVQNGWEVEKSKRAIDWIEKLYSQRDELKRADELHLRVAKLFLKGQYAQAIPLAEQCLEIRAKLLGPNHPTDSSRADLANLYYALRKQRSLEIPLFAQYRKLLSEKKFRQAIPLAINTLEISKEKFGSEDDFTSIILMDMGSLYLEVEDFPKAELFYKQALAIQEKIVGDPDYLVSLHNLGVLFYEMGAYSKAEPYLLQALEVKQSSKSEEADISDANDLRNLGILYRAMENYGRAESFFGRALKIQEKLLGKHNPTYAETLMDLASNYMQSGDVMKAAETMVKYREANSALSLTDPTK